MKDLPETAANTEAVKAKMTRNMKEIVRSKIQQPLTIDEEEKESVLEIDGIWELQLLLAFIRSL